MAVLVLKQTPLAAGIASGAALLVRPNLVLLALAPILGWQQKREPLVRYAIGIAPGVLAIMVINTLLYGGPLSSGYGSLFEPYSWSSVLPNLRNYSVWIVQTQTPVILLALLPLFVHGALRDDSPAVSTRACLGATVGLTFLSYLFYATFNHWFYLRFLLPAYPALFVLLAAALRWLTWKLPIDVRVPAAALVCAVMIPFGVNVARREGVFGVATFEQRHIHAANEVASRTPPDAVVLSVQHSGSVRYYANRTTLRYTGWKRARSMARFAISRRRAVMRISSSTTGKKKNSAIASRRPTAPGAWTGRRIARVPGSPEVRIFDLQDGGPAPAPNEEGRAGVCRVLRHHGRAYISIDHSDGLGASQRRRGPRTEYLDPLVEHAVDTVFKCVVERARVLPGDRDVEFFGEPARPECHCDAAPMARRRTASRLQRRVFFDVPSQRAWRVPARLRVDKEARRRVHRGAAVWLRPLSHRAPAADSVAGVVSDAVRPSRIASISSRFD